MNFVGPPIRNTSGNSVLGHARIYICISKFHLYLKFLLLFLLNIIINCGRSVHVREWWKAMCNEGYFTSTCLLRNQSDMLFEDAHTYMYTYAHLRTHKPHLAYL